MAIPVDTNVHPKFASFHLVDINYKNVNGKPVPATIMVPKGIRPGTHPVMIHWHGGALITGHRLFPDWFADWILQLALSRKAILISPDYRLMPEVGGLEILQDLRDFFSWLAKSGNLGAALPPGVKADVDHILVAGESAGGWLSIQSSLLPSVRPRIAAIIAQYPMIDMRDPHYTGDYEKALFNPPAPQLDRAILRNYLENMNIGETITSAIPPERFPILLSAVQQGKFGKMFGDDRSLYPLEALDGVSNLPPTWLIHGRNDSLVPIEHTFKYEIAVSEQIPKAKLHVSYSQGDHGFDTAPGIGLETDWVKEGVEFIGPYWPQ